MGGGGWAKPPQAAARNLDDILVAGKSRWREEPALISQLTRPLGSLEVEREEMG